MTSGVAPHTVITSPHAVRVAAPAPLAPASLDLGDPAGTRDGIRVTTRCLERDGVPWIPVMGEYHFSRDLPERWERELRKMRAGGVDVVATYLVWILHEEVVVGAAAGIDLHTAANRRANVPQLRIDTTDPHALELAGVFGAPYVLDATLRPGSLREAARQRGVTVVIVTHARALAEAVADTLIEIEAGRVVATVAR